jgi:hypothetical protein
MWLDDCRIPFVDEGDKSSAKPLGKTLKHKGWDTEKWLEETKEPHTQGRFTPNLLVCDDMLNDGKVSISEGGKTTRDTAHFGGGTFKMEGYGDKGTNSRYYDLDLWFDKMLDKL